MLTEIWTEKAGLNEVAGALLRLALAVISVRFW